MLASERCLMLPEMVDKIISFLDKNDQITCLRINSTWRDLAFPHTFNRALSYSRSFERRIEDLLNQQLAQEALIRNSGHIRNVYTGTSGLLPVLIAAPLCTNLVSLECNLSESARDVIEMLGPFIRKNPNLICVELFGVPYTINLEQLVQALQSCSGLTRLLLEYQFEHGVCSRGLASLIRGLAYPHLRLKDLHLDMLVNAPDQGLALFEADRENSSPLFPDLTLFIFHNWHRHCQQVAEVFYLPVLREAPELTCLFVPEMSDSLTAAAAAVIATQKQPLQGIYFGSEISRPGFVDIIKTCRRTLRDLNAEDTICCEPMLRQLLPTNNDATDLTNLQSIKIGLEESPTVSALIQKILTSLSSLKCFMVLRSCPPSANQYPARLQIRDMVATPWTCVGLQELCLFLGSYTAYEDEIETQQERRTKIGQVYKQLGVLAQLKRLELSCNVLGGPSEVELDFTLESGVQAMEPCLKSLTSLDIRNVAGSRISQSEREWVLRHGPQLQNNDDLSFYVSMLPMVGNKFSEWEPEWVTLYAPQLKTLADGRNLIHECMF
ncbi:hypothetical protein BGZ74_004549 [Mortierella antarctica]|nr:hypothetical protein BGZ74_004549 [Mortierella antarctica]